MVPIKDIFSGIISKPNLYQAAYRAGLGKRYRQSTADFNFRLEEQIDQLHRSLSDGSYRHGGYRVFIIRDPKEREIAAASFRDRVVHHAVHDVIEPMIDKTFIFDSYACRVGKGTHAALDRAQRFMRASRYCLHGDIRKYFPSIDHGILKGLLARRIADERLIVLLYDIIDSAKTIKSHAESVLARGLPIGNLTSQFFANLYLHELDHYVKQVMRCRYYIRYMDDFLLLSDSKDLLIEARHKIREFLSGHLALCLHEGKSQIYNTCKGVKFLGFRLFPTYRRLATDNVRRLRKRLKMFEAALARGTMTSEHVRDSVQCWKAHASYANTGGLLRKVLGRFQDSIQGGAYG
jgi:RNA-directed DNA polymerase